MDAGNIIYIIAIIIYFIYTAVKRSQKLNQGNEPEQDTRTGDQRESKQVSFEELLKEIRQGQQERERDFENTGQGTIEKPIPDKPVSRTFEPQKEVQRSDSPRVKRFEQYQGSVSDEAVPEIKTLDEQVSLSSSLEGLGVSKMTVSKKKDSAQNRYAEMLGNRKSVKDAVVLSEILNRKYF